MLLYLAACAWIPPKDFVTPLDLSGAVEAERWDACDTAGVRVRGSVDPVFAGEALDLVLTIGEGDAAVRRDTTLDAGSDGEFEWFPPIPSVLDGLPDSTSATVEDTLDHRTGSFTSTVFLDGPPRSFLDADGDGAGGAPADRCAPPASAVALSDDCDDTDATSFPGGTDVCDGRDNDCNGSIDDDPDAVGAVPWYQDLDGDGQGSGFAVVDACSGPPGTVRTSYDCDDTNPATFFGNPEICDGIDNDCDNLVDAADPGLTDGDTYYVDADGDGVGGATVVSVCPPDLQPSGTVAAGGDCEDDNVLVHPGQVELCNGVDDDCDGSLDEGATGFASGVGGFTDLAAALHSVEGVAGSQFVRACEQGEWDGQDFDFAGSSVELVAGTPGLRILGSAKVDGGSLTIRGFELLGGGSGSAVGAAPLDVGGGVLAVFDAVVVFDGVSIVCDPSQQPVDLGGAVYAERSTLTFTDTDVGFCAAAGDPMGGGGALYGEFVDVVLEGSTTFHDNQTSGSGGAIYLVGSSLVGEEQPTGRPELADNTALQSGGGVYLLDHDAVAVRMLDLRGNESTNSGGGLSFRDSPSMSLQEMSIEGNIAIAGSGGGLYVFDGSFDATLTVNAVAFLGNNATVTGGGAHVPESVAATFDTVMFEDNIATSGGGLRTEYDVVLTSVSFLANRASVQGGGWSAILSDVTNAVVEDTLFSDNSADTVGGGAAVVDVSGGCGALTFGDDGVGSPVLFDQNEAVSGGGLYTRGACEVAGETRLRFTGNSASGSGGGYYNNQTNNLCSSVFFDAAVDFIDNEASSGAAMVSVGACMVDSVGASLWEGNLSSATGGALFLQATGALTSQQVSLGDAVFIGNTGGAGGGAVHLIAPALFTCTGCDFDSADPNLPSDAGSAGIVWNQGVSPPPVLTCVAGNNPVCTP